MKITIYELAFKDRKNLANLNEKDLLDIIEFLQDDRKQWINQFSKTHNESIKIQKENQELKSQLKGTTHCYDEEEHKKLSEQLELLTSKLDEYDLIVDERNQLKKQLEEYKDKINWYENFEVNKTIDKLRLKHNTQQKEFIKWLEDEIKLQEEINDKLLATGFEEVLQEYKEIIGDDKNGK